MRFKWHISGQGGWGIKKPSVSVQLRRLTFHPVGDTIFGTDLFVAVNHQSKRVPVPVSFCVPTRRTLKNCSILYILLVQHYSWVADPSVPPDVDRVWNVKTVNKLKVAAMQRFWCQKRRKVVACEQKKKSTSLQCTLPSGSFWSTFQWDRNKQQKKPCHCTWYFSTSCFFVLFFQDFLWF